MYPFLRKGKLLKMIKQEKKQQFLARALSLLIVFYLLTFWHK